MKKTTKILRYLKKNPGTVFVILAIAFMCAGAFEGVGGILMIPQIRLILHAVSAFFLGLFFNMLGMVVLLITRELLITWFAIIGKLIDREDFAELARKTVIKLVWWVCPFVGTGAYIAKSYIWETDQAVYYGRAIQMDQLTVDIIFSIVAAVIWVLFFNSWARGKAITQKEAKLCVSELVTSIECVVIVENEKIDDKINYFLQLVACFVIVLIPLWVMPLTMLAIKYLAFIPCWGLC